MRWVLLAAVLGVGLGAREGAPADALPRESRDGSRDNRVAAEAPRRLDPQQENRAPPQPPQQRQAQQVPQQQQQQQQQQQYQQQQPNPPAQGGAQNGVRQGGAGKPGESHFANFRECTNDIQRYCHEVDPASDVQIIQCLQDAGETESVTLGADCEHTLWEFKLNLTQDERFHKAASQFCSAQLQQHPDCLEHQANPVKGHMLSCLLDYKTNMSLASPCHKFLARIETIAFSDFRLVGGFLTHCRTEVTKHRCGSLEPRKINSGMQGPDGQAQLPIIHSQGSTLQCLLEKLVDLRKTGEDKINDQCRHEILRIAELQSDDFHLDRPLYFACRSDQERLCRDVQAGEGRVFQCLLSHKTDNRLSHRCAEKLAIRAQLIAQDYKTSHALTAGCARDIQAHQCAPQTGQEPPQHYYLAYVLLCLENAAHKAQQQQQQQQQQARIPLTNQCMEQIMEHRRLLMSDYRMSPEIVIYCHDDISKHCGNDLDGGGGGKTLHCLMGVETSKQSATGGLSANCKYSVQALVKAADPGSDYRVDAVLYNSCRQLIDGECHQEAGSEAEVLSCLMNQVESPKMSDQCEERLLEIQYFLSRDFSLDPQLYQACQANAAALCGAQSDWWKPPTDGKNSPDPGPTVLACLYRHAYEDEAQGGLSKQCSHEVHRVLRERAQNVRLMPEVEEPCRAALSAHCSQATQPGEELRCLQGEMEKEDFGRSFAECKKALESFTEMESKDVRLNRALTRACAPVLQTHCADLMEEEIDHGDVMDCLVQQKASREMNDKCKAYVTHFQLVSLAEVRFSPTFKKACGRDIGQHCQHFGSDKAAIVRCLSTIIFEHRVLKEGPGLENKCKKQVKVEYLAEEKLEADEDEDFWTICKSDIKALKCFQDGDTVEDAAECLKRNKGKMRSPECHRLIFGRELVEAADNTFDHPLMAKCKAEMDTFCKGVSPDEVLECLQDHLEDAGMSSDCADVIVEREEEDATDIRLQPKLLDACREDVQVMCPKQAEMLRKKGADVEEAHGEILYCLRSALIASDPAHKGQVSFNCQLELKKLIMEGEVDPKVDPQFYKACEEEITKHCGKELFGADSHGHRLECMKSAYFKSKITNQKCNKEMERRTAERLMDIHLDPVLHEACAGDINKYCKDTPPGYGRIVQCLMGASRTAKVELESSCDAKLRERDQLWRAAHEHGNVALPQNIGELAQLALASPERNSIASMLFGGIFLLFIAGLCCGRVTKRVRREIKDR